MVFWRRKGFLLVLLLSICLLAAFASREVFRSSGKYRVVPSSAASNDSPMSIIDPRHPVVPQGIPLRDSFASLKTRASTGDERSAIRLFRETQYCLQSMRLAMVMSKSAEVMVEIPTDKMSAKERAAMEASFSVVDGLMASAQESARTCAGLGREQMAEALPAALRAALAGDLLAANCYVGTDFMSPPPGLFEHPEWLTEYKKHAPDLAKRAIVRGDWAMVGQMARASSKVGSSWLSQVVSGDPAENYRYLRLLKLGVSSETDARGIDHLLRAAERTLPEESKRSADVWAHQTFRDDFGGVPDTEGASRRPACELVGGLRANE